MIGREKRVNVIIIFLSGGVIAGSVNDNIYMEYPRGSKDGTLVQQRLTLIGPWVRGGADKSYFDSRVKYFDFGSRDFMVLLKS